MFSSCTSPQPPRFLTLLSTRLRSPTPVASCCISPSPRWTCSSRSETSLNEASRRVLRVVCSFSSTVPRICSSLAALSACSSFRRSSRVLRISPMRCSLRWISSLRRWPSVSAKRCCDSAPSTRLLRASSTRVSRSAVRCASMRAISSLCCWPKCSMRASCCWPNASSWLRISTRRWLSSSATRCCAAPASLRPRRASSLSVSRSRSRRWSVRVDRSARWRAKPSLRASCCRARLSSCSRSSPRPLRCSSRSTCSSAVWSVRRNSTASSSTSTAHSRPARIRKWGSVCMPPV